MLLIFIWIMWLKLFIMIKIIELIINLIKINIDVKKGGSNDKKISIS